jgi:hypothetical protein
VESSSHLAESYSHYCYCDSDYHYQKKKNKNKNLSKNSKKITKTAGTPEKTRRRLKRFKNLWKTLLQQLPSPLREINRKFLSFHLNAVTLNLMNWRIHLLFILTLFTIITYKNFLEVLSWISAPFWKNLVDQ